MNELAGIQYAGIAGLSEPCLDAVVRILQYGDRVTSARILTCEHVHCLLLTLNVGELVAIKSGFSSGYGGQGPWSFSQALQLLEEAGAEIDEYQVEKAVIDRVNAAALTRADLGDLDAAHPVLPARWYDYTLGEHRQMAAWGMFKPVVPFGIIDSRILDLAISFWDDPDSKLLTGYRRLEDIVRKRSGIENVGGESLFARAFLANNAPLGWTDLSDNERSGRAALFSGAYKAHRNPRAHKEQKGRGGEGLAEFLLLNHLYLLESESVERESQRDDEAEETARDG